MRNTDAMQPVYPDFTNGTDNRNPVSYVTALSQFDFVNNPRYAVRNGNTWCNIALWDGSRALGCEIPHFRLYYVKTAEGKVQLTGQEFNANAVANWFAGVEDELAGWSEVPVETAQTRANAGYPTVVIWKNPGGTGHVAWVVPSKTPGELLIAQAGAKNYFGVPLKYGFGNAGPLKYYTHD
jgi:hypothetical protein